MPTLAQQSATWIDNVGGVLADPTWQNLHGEQRSIKGIAQVQSLFLFQGNLFWIGQQLQSNAGDKARFGVWLASDNGGSWTLLDAGNAPKRIVGDTDVVGSWSLDSSGRFIIGAFLNVKAVPIPFAIWKFDLQTQTWSGPLGSGAPAATAIGTCTTRPDGRIVVTYSPSPAAGSTIWVTSSLDLNIWAAAVDLGTNLAALGGTVPTLTKTAVACDSSNNCHFFMRNGDSPPQWIYQELLPNTTLGINTNLGALFSLSDVGMGNCVLFKNNVVLVAATGLGASTTNVIAIILDLATLAISSAVVAAIGGPVLDWVPQICTDGIGLLVTLPIQDASSFRTKLFTTISKDMVNWAAIRQQLNPNVDSMPPGLAPDPQDRLISNTLPAIFPELTNIVFMSNDIVSAADTAIDSAFFLSGPSGLFPTAATMPFPQSGLQFVALGFVNSCCKLCDQPKETGLRYPILRNKSMVYRRMK